VKLITLAKRNFFLSRQYATFLAGAGFLCMVLLLIVNRPAAFGTYIHALQIAFAVACAAILIGLLLSIGLICEDYVMIRRELMMGLSPSRIIFAKVINIIIYCFVISIILIIPYRFDYFAPSYLRFWHLYVSVFFTMLTSASLGLLVSAACIIKPQIASLAVSIIMLFQILFSGFLFDYSWVDISYTTISYYSIRTIGSGLGFHNLGFNAYAGHGTFGISPGHAVATLGMLFLFSIVPIAISILTLYLIRRKGWVIKLRPE